MSVNYRWLDDEKTILAYVPEGNWNWRDFYRTAQIASFSIPHDAEIVDIVVDLRESGRSRLPSGIRTHIRTFGKKHHDGMSGRAVIIGMPPDDEALLGAGESRHVATQDGFAQLVDTLEEALEVIQEWRS